jgi:hypothetical protein
MFIIVVVVSTVALPAVTMFPAVSMVVSRVMAHLLNS